MATAVKKFKKMSPTALIAGTVRRCAMLLRNGNGSALPCLECLAFSLPLPLEGRFRPLVTGIWNTLWATCAESRYALPQRHLASRHHPPPILVLQSLLRPKSHHRPRRLRPTSALRTPNLLADYSSSSTPSLPSVIPPPPPIRVIPPVVGRERSGPRGRPSFVLPALTRLYHPKTKTTWTDRQVTMVDLGAWGRSDGRHPHHHRRRQQEQRIAAVAVGSAEVTKMRMRKITRITRIILVARVRNPCTLTCVRRYRRIVKSTHSRLFFLSSFLITFTCADCFLVPQHVKFSSRRPLFPTATALEGRQSLTDNFLRCLLFSFPFHLPSVFSSLSLSQMPFDLSRNYKESFTAINRAQIQLSQYDLRLSEKIKL